MCVCACVCAWNRASRAAKHEYFVLVILTDGEITDLDKTIDGIIKASGVFVANCNSGKKKTKVY